MTEPSTTPPLFDPPEDFLRGRTVLITGASGGLGEALVHACARHGATLIMAGRDVHALERLSDGVLAAGHRQPVIFPVDFSGATAADYEQMAEAVGAQFECLDAVIHLAAEFDGLTPLAQTDPASWSAAIQVNLTAPFLINQAVLALLRRSDRPRIVFTLDDPSRVSGAYWGAYGVSKQGLVALAKISAGELEAFGIEVNAVLPPPLATRLRRRSQLDERGHPPAPPATVAGVYLYLLAEHPKAVTGEVFAAPTGA